MALWSMQRPTIASTSTVWGSSSGSSPCSRDSSMICWTSRVSRWLSVCMRPANRVTASGSSAASCTASASRLSAPTGVFSSWDTLATKSRRIASTRRSRVRSSTSASTSRLLSGATRAVTCNGATARPRDSTSSVSRICPSRRTCRTSSASSSTATALPRTRPKAYAGAEALSTSSFSSTTRALDRSTESTVAMPGGTAGSSAGTRSCIWCSLTRHARTTPAPSTAPSSAKRRACVGASTARSYAPTSTGVRPAEAC